MTAALLLLMAGAYLFGTVPFGLIVARSRGVNIREHGSGNYGATNVGRVLGRKWGLLVFVLDVSKGALTPILAKWAVGRFGLLPPGSTETAVDAVLLGAGLCCVIGNTAPFYLGFKGGKGVATSLGVILGIWPHLTIPGILTFVVWGLVTVASGYVSLGSIVAAIGLPLIYVGVAKWQGWDIGRHWPLLALTLAMTVLVVFRHRANISRLLAGTENRIGRGGSKKTA